MLEARHCNSVRGCFTAASSLLTLQTAFSALLPSITLCGTSVPKDLVPGGEKNMSTEAAHISTTASMFVCQHLRKRHGDTGPLGSFSTHQELIN